MLFASEGWEIRKSDYDLIESFNRKAISWNSNYNSYKNEIMNFNLLPPLYFKVLKDLLLYSSNLNQRYEVDFSTFYEIRGMENRRRIKLPELRYEVQRSNFWSRTGLRINMIQSKIDFYEDRNLKRNLIRLMWNFFKENWTENNPCSWIFLCLCEKCRANQCCKLFGIISQGQIHEAIIIIIIIIKGLVFSNLRQTSVTKFSENFSKNH